MSAYYNENDPFAAAWLRALIADNQIAQGDVDERSIADVAPSDLHGYTQCHFFAGIGGWSYALRLAGWPDDRACWTGSCPCQPFSAAGAGLGFDDPRHLWPQWFRLLRVHRPVVCFGEQVDKALAWLDLVSGDLEGEGYAVGSVIVGAHSVGAPHRRQRIYWVSNAERSGRAEWGAGARDRQVTGVCGGGLALSNGRHSRPEGIQRSGEQRFVAEDGGSIVRGRCTETTHGPDTQRRQDAVGDERRVLGASTSSGTRSSVSGSMGDSNQPRSQGRSIRGYGPDELSPRSPSLDDNLDQPSSQGLAQRSGRALSPRLPRSLVERSSDYNYWRTCDWLPCQDGRSRPTQPGLFPLAHGIPGRVGRLRGYGNAIVPQLAAAFVASCMEVAA